MYLTRILGSKTKTNLISVLISHPESTFVENELAKEAGVSISEANRQIMDLVNVGLISMHRIGKSKVYQVNQKHFLFKPLKTLFRSLDDVYREIANKVVTFTTQTDNIETVVLFGSLATGKVRSDFVKEPSDIDILIIVKEEKQVEPTKNNVLNFLGSEIFPVYGINVYPIVLSVEKYLSDLSTDMFIMNVHSNGEVLYGEKPRGFSKVVFSES